MQKQPDLENIIREHLVKFPYMTQGQLARYLIEHGYTNYHPEALRKVIRKVKSELGNIQTSDFGTNFDCQPELQLPDSWYSEQQEFEIPPIYQKIAVLNDIHIPFHHKEHLQIALDYIYRWQPDCILLNGDIMDFYAVSPFVREPQYRDLNKEVEVGKKFLEYLSKRFPGVKIIYKLGNHEGRMQMYLWKKAEELNEVKALRVQNLLEFEKFGIDFVDVNQAIRIGALWALHGHEIPASGGLINVARNLRLKGMDNLIFGHFHRSQEDIVTTISGKAIGAWSVGCLCGLRPMFRPISFWNAGFALITRENELFSIENKKIILGRVL